MSKEKKVKNFRVPKYKYGQEVFVFTPEDGIIKLIVKSVRIKIDEITYDLSEPQSIFTKMESLIEESVFDTKDELIKWVIAKLK